MEIFKITTIIFAIGLIIASILLVINLDGNEDTSETNQELISLKADLQDKINKLSEKSEELNMSESFLNSYLNGLGMYYTALEFHDNVTYKYDQAQERYQSGHWSNSLAWFWDTSDWCEYTKNKYQEASDVFIEAMKNTTNNNYEDICNIYANMMNVSSIAIIYLNEACDLYADSCEFYLDGDYDGAHESKDNAVIKISYYDEQIDIFNDYQLELKNILMNVN
jgi:hypothetical protein